MRGPAVALAIVLAWGSLRAQSQLDVSVNARDTRPGDVVVVTTRTDTPADDVTVHLFDHRIPVFRTDTLTWTAVAGIDLDVPPGTYTAVVHALGPQGAHQASATLTIEPGRFPTRRLRVDPAFVDPPPDAVSRILSEADRLERLWAGTGTRLWAGPFVAPVTGRPVGRFGARSVFNGQPRAPHAGEDYAHATGTTIVIDHGAGLFSLVAHLSAMNVAVGDRVTTGQRIGAVGATGRVTGPHLHWSVRLGGARVNPSSLLAALGANAAAPARATARRLPR